jgi:hypothetical protein
VDVLSLVVNDSSEEANLRLSVADSFPEVVDVRLNVLWDDLIHPSIAADNSDARIITRLTIIPRKVKTRNIRKGL